MHVHAGSSEHVIDKVVGAAEFHFVFERRPRVAPPPTPSVPVTPPAPAASTTAPSSSPPSSDSSKISTASASTTISQRTSSVTTSEQLSSNLSPNLSSSSTSPLFQSSLSSALSSSLMGLVPPANAEENTGTISSSTDRPTTQTLVVAILAKRADESAEWISNLLKPFLAKAGADGRGPGILLDMDIATTMLAEFDSTDLFVYNGSLTTPPCTEGVTWVVLRSKCGIAPEDVDTITRLQKGVNVRPLQPTNDRRVIRFPRVPLSS